MQKSAQTSFKSQQRKEGSALNRIPVYRLFAAAALLGACIGSLLILQNNNEPTNLLPPAVSCAEAWNGNSCTTTSEATETTPAQTTLPAADGFMLRLNDDILSVYITGYDEPMEMYSVTAAWLPDYDRILLENGLFVATEQELRDRLEDYTS